MAFCKNCGEPLTANQDVCLSCGTAVEDKKIVSSGGTVVDNGGFGWGLLGFCIPLVGLILFLVWKSEKPKTAQAAIIGAAIGFVVTFISYFIFGANLAI